MNEYPQERFHGKTPAVVRAEAFKTDHPAEYPIQPNLRIQNNSTEFENPEILEKNRAKKIGNEWLAIHYQYTTIFSYFIVSTLQGRIK